MPMNESYHILNFRSLHKFTDKPPLLCHLLDVIKATKMGRKFKQSLEVPILTRKLYVFTSKDLSFGTCWQVIHVMLVFLIKIDPHRKNDISGYIWHRSFIQTVKCSLLDGKIVYQSFYGAPLTFGFFRHASARHVRKFLIAKTLWKKLYLWLYLTQIVHSNGKMLLL